jgi:hypothetical protein
MDGTTERRGLRRGLVIAILVLVGLGVIICLVLVATTGFPFSPRPSDEPMPTDTATPTATYTPEPTWPPFWTPTPTRTPIPTNTPTPPPPTPRPGSGSSGSWPGSGHTGPYAPLTIDYTLNGRECSGSGYIAEFTVWAQGGDGKYTYYRDIDLIAGPLEGSVTYEVKWRDCGGAPGTFFVESGDGQRVSKLFWIHPPGCCKK